MSTHLSEYMHRKYSTMSFRYVSLRVEEFKIQISNRSVVSYTDIED